MVTVVYRSLRALRPSAMCATSHVSRNRACVLQSCPDAIEEVFDTKLHIIGGVGLAIGVVMVSV